MYENIFNKWQQKVSESASWEVLPIFQRRDIFLNMLSSLCSNNDRYYYLPKIIEFVESNNFDYHSFINSLFMLRDIFISEANNNHEAGFNLQQALQSLQDIIIKVGSYFSVVNVDLNVSHRQVHTLEPDLVEGNILFLNHQFEILKTNSTLLTYFGYEKKEVTGKSILTLFAPSSQNIIKNAIEKLQNNHRLKMELEVEAQKKNGQKFQVLLRIARTNINETPAKFSAYIKDNTYVHETKSVLNLLSMALESVGEGIVILEPDAEGTILYVNKAMEKMSGYARHQLLGKPLTILRNPTNGDNLERKIIQKTLKDGWRGEITNLHKKGYSYIVHLHTQPIRNEDGKIVALVGIERDITQAKSREAQIIHLQKFVEHIINNLPHFVIVTDTNRQIKFWNQSLENELGITAEEVIGKNISEVLPQLNWLNLDVAVNYVISSGEMFIKKFFVDLSNSGEKYYKLYLTPIKTDSEQQLLWTILDITKEELLKIRITWQNARLKFLENFSQLLNKNLDLRAIFQQFTQELREVLPFRTLSFLIPYNLESLQFNLFFFSSAGKDTFPQNHTICFAKNEIYRKIVTHREIKIRDLSEDGSDGRLAAEEAEFNEDLRQIVHLPICFEKEILGIFNIGHWEAEYYKQDDLDFLQQIASHMAIALKNSFYFNMVECQNKKLSIINSIFKESRHPAQIFRLFMQALTGLKNLLQSESGAFYLSEDGHHWKKNSAIHSEPQLPEMFTLTVSDIPDGSYFWDKFHPCKFDFFPDQSTEKYSSGQFSWESSNSFGYVGFLSVNNHILDRVTPEYMSILVSDVLKQMVIAIDQLYLFEKLKQAEQEWKTTFDTVNIGLAIINPQGKIIQFNKAFCDIYNFTQNELAGKTADEIFSNLELLELTCLSDNPRQIPPLFEQEYYDSSIGKTILRTFYPIFDSQHRFIGGIFSIADVTAQRQQEAKIRFLSKFPETNPNIVISLDQKGNASYINPAAMKLLEKLSLTAKDIHKILPSHLDRILQHFKEKGETHLELEHKFLDQVFEYIIYRPSDDHNFYFYGTNITEKVELQRQLLQTERIRAVGEMAAGVAHDFNNLLATILGKTQLLLLKEDSQNTREELAIIEKAALDGGKIVQRIQEVTREKRDKNYQPLDVNELIRESIIFSANKLKVNTQLKGKPVHLHTNLKDNLIVKGNEVELKEVFTNLLLNAYDAMPNGGDLYIDSTITDEQNALISIRDTGAGMPEEVMNKIFNPFFTTKGDKGTGLGLSIAYNTVTSHGGIIKIESEVGKGSTFTIILPLSQEKPKKKSREEVRIQETVSELRLLIVDDEPELLNTMAEILKLKFKSVEISDCGPDALKKIEKQSYDIVLTDLGMPEMSGWELAEKIKQIRPQTKIILVTGWGNQAKEELKYHPYVDEILAKPYELRDLMIKISKFTQ
ncbi:MAG: hypothetical protein Kow0042_25670 [Calditrichia bacterium]